MSRKPIKFDEDGLPIPVKEQQTVSFDSDGLPIPIKKKSIYGQFWRNLFKSRIGFRNPFYWKDTGSN